MIYSRSDDGHVKPHPDSWREAPRPPEKRECKRFLGERENETSSPSRVGIFEERERYHILVRFQCDDMRIDVI